MSPSSTSSSQWHAEVPFKIQVPDQDLQFLHQKLALTVLPDELEGANRDYGAPLSDIQRLLARWKDGYDWRTHEKAINDELPQFKRLIAVDGFWELDVHYVHKKSKVEAAIPLLFIHGCEWLFSMCESDTQLCTYIGPGSFCEVRKILPLLTEASPNVPSFHVVALSQPGYGFSAAPKKRGFDMAQYAEVRCVTHAYIG